MMIPIIILAIVFFLIAVRQIGSIRLQIWQVMLFGAAAVLLTGQISPQNAITAINFDVILFLFGMFIIGEALDESGYLSHFSYKIFKRARTAHALLFLILVVMGAASALLMNDTLAIIGTPVVLLLARKYRMSSKPLLLALACAVSIGSVISPIGNPHNLMIALNGNVPNPFVTFFQYLFIPTALNILVAYILLRLFYKDHIHGYSLSHSQEPIKDHDLAVISAVSLILIIILIIAKIVLVAMNIGVDFKLTYIALVSALPILLFSRKRVRILQRLDWCTLVFFAAMFILVGSVWETGFFQSLIKDMNIDITSIAMILVISVVVGQFISNVPLVALYIPLLLSAGASTREMMALVAGSTMAGNLFILGAASNVIIIQNAEKKSGETITFMEFAALGIPLTILNTIIYWIFL